MDLETSLRLQLLKELGRLPVYSADTTTGKEAEFIREREELRIVRAGPPGRSLRRRAHNDLRRYAVSARE